MSNLKNLIRLHQWQVDEARRKLLELERLAAHLRDQLRRLDEQHAADMEVARGSVESRLAFGTYTKTMIERRRVLESSINEVVGKIDGASQELSAEFQELKKFELAEQLREKRIQAEQARRERIAQDEQAIENFRRRKQAN